MTFNKNAILLIISILLIIGIGFLVWYRLGFKKNTVLTDDNNGSDIVSSVAGNIFYEVREVTAVGSSGPSQYLSTIYSSDRFGGHQKQIFSSPTNMSVKLLANNSVAVFDREADSKEVKIIDKTGHVIRTIPLDHDQNTLVASPDSLKYAYTSTQIALDSEGGQTMNVGYLVITSLNGMQVELKPTDFFPSSDNNFSRIEPLGFSSDSQEVYVAVWPVATGGDIADPHGYYKYNLTDGTITELVFSGSKKLNYTLSESEPAIISFTLFPKTPKALVISQTEKSPKKISIIDLESLTQQKLFTIGLGGDYPELVLAPQSISDDERYIAFNKEDNSGFFLYDLQMARMSPVVSNTGNHIGWFDSTHSINQVLRQHSWDDKQFTLKIVNIDNLESNTIYTQETDHVEGAGLSKVGDKYYEFIGVIK